MSPFDSELVISLNLALGAALGIHHAVDRPDLQKTIELAASDLGIDSLELARKLCHSPPNSDEIQALVRHCTVGETYFFRDSQAFDALESALLAILNKQERNLRVLSAGCCTGEEAYSLAMMIDFLATNRHVEIVAVDINQDFLALARSGLYGAWAFRNLDARTSEYKKRYFSQVDNQQQIAEHIRKMVHFLYFNLADPFELYQRRLGEFDLILCRNVLIYFDKAMIAPVIDSLARSLTPGGLLMLAATESPGVNLPDLKRHVIPYLFEKTAVTTKSVQLEVVDWQTQIDQSRALFSAGDYRGCRKLILRLLDGLRKSKNDRLEIAALHLLVRSLSNLALYEQAMSYASQLVALDSKAEYRYLYAVVLSEGGKLDQAADVLEILWLTNRQFIAAAFMLANIAMRQNRSERAKQYLLSIRQNLIRLSPDALIECTDGISAREMSAIVERLLGNEV